MTKSNEEIRIEKLLAQLEGIVLDVKISKHEYESIQKAKQEREQREKEKPLKEFKSKCYKQDLKQHKKLPVWQQMSNEKFRREWDKAWEEDSRKAEFDVEFQKEQITELAQDLEVGDLESKQDRSNDSRELTQEHMELFDRLKANEQKEVNKQFQKNRKASDSQPSSYYNEVETLKNKGKDKQKLQDRYRKKYENIGLEEWDLVDILVSFKARDTNSSLSTNQICLVVSENLIGRYSDTLGGRPYPTVKYIDFQYTDRERFKDRVNHKLHRLCNENIIEKVKRKCVDRRGRNTVMNYWYVDGEASQYTTKKKYTYDKGDFNTLGYHRWRKENISKTAEEKKKKEVKRWKWGSVSSQDLTWREVLLTPVIFISLPIVIAILIFEEISKVIKVIGKYMNGGSHRCIKFP